MDGDETVGNITVFTVAVAWLSVCGADGTGKQPLKHADKQAPKITRPLIICIKFVFICFNL
jgi:hypothetical protein